MKSIKAIFFICSIFLVSCLSTTIHKQESSIAQNIGEGRPLQVLCLGQLPNKHDLLKLGQDLFTSLSKKGIFFTYTSDTNSLNTENLNKYDALIFYANFRKITDDQESALLNYVESGHGFLPIHSASACFTNSKKYAKLVGGQFKSHQSEIFTAKIINKNHPAMKGVEEFSCWDETYVHKNLVEDKTVLMLRNKEPWTWVRNQGLGRVFYTASGHDERSWSNKGFIKMLEQGILWAVGDKAKAEWEQLNLQPLKYQNVPVPNYRKASPAPQFQEPLSAEESMKYTQVPVGFKLELFASEPMIRNPICMNWDDQGRLWVAESVDYPNNILEGSKGNDSIKILEDTDNDGRADKVTVFAKDLNIPTSFTFWNDGILVTMAPYTYFMQDTNGDDKADVIKKMHGGWGLADTHAGPSNMKYGLDNHIWGAVGYSGFNGVVGKTKAQFRVGLYRWKRDIQDVEFMSRFTNNTWGLGFNESGDVFGGTANRAHSFHMAIARGRYAALDQFNNVGGTSNIDGQKYIYPNIKTVRQVDVHGGFTSAAGHNIYTARTYPKEYWNRMSLICEPTGKLLYKGILEKSGSGYVDVNNYNLLASVDEWMSPVHAEVGPDGQVWICDWYNFIIQHNPFPKGYKRGKGNAYVESLRDNKRGRIYRIVYEKGTPSKQYKLSKDNPKLLLEALKDNNKFWRIRAQRLLVERGQKDVYDQLLALASDQTVDDIGLNPQVIHALWTLEGLEAAMHIPEKFRQVISLCLKHKSAAVRKNAIRVMARDGKTLELFLSQGCLAEKDPNTRLAAILKASEFTGTPALAKALLGCANDKNNLTDQWLREALAITASVHYEMILTAMPKGNNEVFKQKERPNLLIGGDFELDETQFEKIWKKKVPRPRRGKKKKNAKPDVPAVVKVDAVCKLVEGRLKGKALELTATTDKGVDTSYVAFVRVKHQGSYLLSGWVKTSGVKGLTKKALGASLSVEGVKNARSKVLSGDNDWEFLTVRFNSGRRGKIAINCSLGGQGNSVGRVVFDDLKLEDLNDKSSLNTSQVIFQCVGESLAKQNSKKALFSFLKAKASYGGQPFNNVLQGLSQFWEKKLDLNMQDKNFLSSITGSQSVDQSALTSLLVKVGFATAAPGSNTKRVVDGSLVFKTYCISCHGLQGEGSVGPNLTDMFSLHDPSKESVEKIIRKGIPGKAMMPWEQMLKKDEIEAVRDHIISLRGKNVKGKEPEGKKIKEWNHQ